MIGNQVTYLEVALFTILITLNPTDQPARLEKLG